MVFDLQKYLNYLKKLVNKLYNFNQISSKHVNEAKNDFFQPVSSA